MKELEQILTQAAGGVRAIQAMPAALTALADDNAAIKRQIEAITAKGQPKPTDDRIPARLDVRDFGPPKEASDAYEKCVNHILDTWAIPQLKEPHKPSPGPNVSGFQGTSQLTLPEVYFGPDNYVFDRTLWGLGQIPVVFSGWNARAWFEGDPANYADDQNEWIPGQSGPQWRGLKLAIAMANDVTIANTGLNLIGYNSRIENINAKFDIGPCVGIAALGHHHNARIVNTHLVCDGDVARRKSVAVATIPSSVPRLTPFGVNDVSWVNPDKTEKGYSVHNQDMRIERLMVEYWDKGAEVTGAGLMLEMMAYYTRTGFHYFGQSGFGKEHVQINAQIDAEGHKGFGANKEKGFWNVGDCLAGIITRASSHWPVSIKVESALDTWINSEDGDTAPESIAGWRKGETIW